MADRVSNTCMGIFTDPREADQAVDELRGAGFKTEDISVIMREEGRVAPTGRGGEVAKDATAGVATGGAIGGIAGLIVGIVAVTVPGIGALIATGPLAIALGLIEVGATTLAGAITGGAAGGIIGGLIGLGVPKERAEAYEEAVRRGQILLAVSVTPDNMDKATAIFRSHNASQVCNVQPKK
jgi:hypothetical protein